MKYFEVKSSSPRGGKGEFIKGYHQNGSVHSEFFLGNLHQYNRIEIQPIIPTVEIGSNFSVPDIFIPGGPISGRLVISSSLKKVLNENGADRLVQYFPISIIQDGEELNNFCITQFLSFNNELLDFEKSVFTEKFYLYETNGWVKTNRIAQYLDRKFSSMEELMKRTEEIYSNGGFLRGKNLFINDSCNCDVILLEENLSSEIIISEHLKSSIEDMNFKGLLFKPLEWSEKDWFGPDSPLKQNSN
jgi:hypothetical protein